MKGLVNSKKKCIVLIALIFVVSLIIVAGVMSEKDNTNEEENNVSQYEVGIQIERVENWFFSKYAVDVFVDDKYKTSVENGATEVIVLELEEGIHTLKIEHDEDDIYSEEIFRVEDEETFKFKVNCYSSEIDIEVIEENENTETTSYFDLIAESVTDTEKEEINVKDDNKIVITKNDKYYLGKDYEDVENEFLKLGFKNIEVVSVENTEGDYEDGAVCNIEIDGKSFAEGDKFNKEAEICIEYLSLDEEDYTLFYSNNTREEAINGNSGTFAYRSRGKAYDLYWIIDFEEGFVYNFSDEDVWCDRLKIDNGDLNTAVKITYHDGDDVWSYKLHFKYKNAPETLVMIDQNGYDYYYETTDLQDALFLKESKKITDY